MADKRRSKPDLLLHSFTDIDGWFKAIGAEKESNSNIYKNILAPRKTVKTLKFNVERLNKDLISNLKKKSSLKKASLFDNLESLSHDELLPMFSKIFQKLNLEVNNEKLKQEFFKSMEFKTYKQNEVVFNYGDQGDLFYVILKGKVSVKVPTIVYKELDENQLYEILNTEDPEWKNWILTYTIANNVPQEHREKSLASMRRPSMIKKVKPKVEETSTKKMYRINYLKHVAELQAGDGFGELALMNNKPRAASIIALSQPTKLATISKTAYMLILDKQFRILLRRKIEWMREFCLKVKINTFSFSNSFSLKLNIIALASFRQNLRKACILPRRSQFQKELSSL